ncbi:MAG TPA: thioredoxin family protein [Nitrososphaeraceae archaeon]|nr:thioredoxin family protein [Nitrososphaeraceae archaeon]
MITVKQFSSSWCGSCKILSKNLEGKDIEYIDIEDNIELSAKLGVRQIPMLAFYKDDLLLERKVGVISVKEFDEIIEKYGDK